MSMRLLTVRVHKFVIGGHPVKYPVLGSVNCKGAGSGADSNCTVFASTTVITADMRAGEVLHSGGYLLEATRVVKIGEAVPTLLFIGNKGQSILSIEAALKTKDKGDAAKPQPWLTIFHERLKPGDRTPILKAWRGAKKTLAPSPPGA